MLITYVDDWLLSQKGVEVCAIITYRMIFNFETNIWKLTDLVLKLSWILNNKNHIRSIKKYSVIASS